MKAAQEMGFSLREIEDLLAMREGQSDSCETMRQHLAGKLDAVRRKIRLLRVLEEDLASGVERCDEQIRQGRGHECPVLDELGSGVSYE